MEEKNESTIEKINEKKFEKLELDMKEIIQTVEKIPEKYREKAFEVLLNHSLSGKKLETIKEEKEHDSLVDYTFQMPIEVRAFLRQFSISEEKIHDLFIITGQNEVAPSYKLKTKKTAVAQNQLALLTALENTLKGEGKFEFAIEEIRKKCIDYGFYDQKNFMKNFRQKNFFKDLTDNEHVALSPHGKEYLAEVINDL